MHRPALVLAVLGALLAQAAGIEAAEHEGLGAIRQRGHVRVCADPSNLPYSSEDPAAPGFEVELARLIAEGLGVPARFVWNSTYVRALRPLRENACDLFLGLPTDTRFREGNPWIAVSRPYYVMTHALLTRSASDVRALGDLDGKRVAVERAGVADFYIGYRPVHRGIYQRQDEAVRAVAAGEAAAALVWLPVASWLARGRSDLLVIPVSDPALEFAIGAGVRRRERDLAAAVDDAVARLEASGRTREILLRYGAIPSPRTRRHAGPLVLAQAANTVETGRSLFSTACSRCHGADGVGGGLGGVVPSIKNYDAGEQKFVRVVREGKRGTPMAPFKGILTDDEIRSIYHYLTSRPRS